MSRAAALRVCFVCTGNTCRSPVAEVITRALLTEAGLADAVETESAGTGDHQLGEPINPRAAAALSARGYPPPPGHRARRFNAAWFSPLDLVVALDSGHLAELRRMAPSTEARRRVRLLRSFDPASTAADDLDVPDPYNGSAEDYRRVLDLVEPACRGLVGQLRDGSAAPRAPRAARPPLGTGPERARAAGPGHDESVRVNRRAPSGPPPRRSAASTEPAAAARW